MSTLIVHHVGPDRVTARPPVVASPAPPPEQPQSTGRRIPA